MATISQSLFTYLTSSPSEFTNDPKRIDALRHVRDMVGTAVFVNRRPGRKGHQWENPSQREASGMQVVIKQLADDSFYHLQNEFKISSPLIQVDAYAKGDQSGFHVEELSGWLHLALTNFSGKWGEATVWSCLKVLQTSIPAYSRDASKLWTDIYHSGYRISFQSAGVRDGPAMQ